MSEVTTEAAQEISVSELEKVAGFLFEDANPIGQIKVIRYVNEQLEPGRVLPSGYKDRAELFSKLLKDTVDLMTNENAGSILRNVIRAMRDNNWKELTMNEEKSRPHPEAETATVTTTPKDNTEDTPNTRLDVDPDGFDVNKLIADKKSYLTDYVNGFVISARDAERVTWAKQVEQKDTKIKSLNRELAIHRAGSKPAAGDETEVFNPEVPELDKHYKLSKDVVAMLDGIVQLSDESPQNVELRGGPSSGKSACVRWLAAKHGRPFHSVNCAITREAGHWFGGIRAENGSTKFVESEFVRAITHGNVIVRVEEWNRLSPYVQNALYEILDPDQRQTYVEGYGMVRVAPGTIFMATANVGTQYQGTYKMCESMQSRFTAKIEFPDMDSSLLSSLLQAKTGVSEDVANKCGTIHQQVLDKTRVVGTGSYDAAITYRQWEAACKLWHKIGNKAFEYTVLNSYSDEGVDSQRSQLIKLFAGVELL